MNKELVLRNLDALLELVRCQEHNPHEANGIYRAIETVENLPDDNQWIPVAERLPEDNQKVWITKEYRGGDRGIDTSVFKGNEFLVPGFLDVVCTDLVKAWMPKLVPEPYKEES